jgi:LmbE family N-acetylglucosaminyl deacetylase
MKNKVLVIAPHADDEVLGCGGTIARHTSEGDEVHILIVTCGISDIYSPEFLERGRQEARDAGNLLNVSSVKFLDFPAPKLDTIDGYKLASAISEVIRALSPNVLFLPHRGDIHTDHQAVYQAALVAARPINDCSVTQILSYETLSETEWAPPCADVAFIPTVFVDITNYLELKLKAMYCYQNQLKHPPHPRSLQTIEALARLRGATVGLPAAEAFMLVRNVVK